MAPKSPPLIVAYASWNECDERGLRAARQGANVIVWFAINLVANASGHPAISGGPSPACVLSARAALEAEGLPTAHMISIGGWNAPHPPDHLARPADWWAALDAYNHQAPRALFDGIDIDLEGSDAPAESEAAHLAANTLSVPCLDLIGELSVLAKRSGLLVSLAPPQSYLTASTPAFNRTALQPPLGWPQHSRFRYAGRNAYAYLLARYGRAQPPAGTSAAAGRDGAPPTYDWVFLQLYESWGLAHAQLAAGQPLGSVLREILEGFAEGWLVEFGRDEALGFASARVRVPPSAVVLGLANGWAAPRGAGAQPALFVCPRAVRAAYESLPPELRPRGFGFWSIAEEGRQAPCGSVPTHSAGAPEAAPISSSPLFMARALNDFLHVRTDDAARVQR